MKASGASPVTGTLEGELLNQLANQSLIFIYHLTGI